MHSGILILDCQKQKLQKQQHNQLQDINKYNNYYRNKDNTPFISFELSLIQDRISSYHSVTDNDDLVRVVIVMWKIFYLLSFLIYFVFYHWRKKIESALLLQELVESVCFYVE